LDLLKQIASTFELEIRFRTEIMGSFIVGRYVDLIKKVGRDNGKEFLLGKDVQGIRRIENSQDVVTALVGVGPQNSETGEFLTFEEINNGKLYVGNNDALQRWSKDGKHLFDIYSPQTEDQGMTKPRLKQLTEAELKKRIDSSTSYEVNAVALEKVFGLSHESVRKGDTVRIKDTGFSPPLFLEARLIAADECDTDPSKDKYIFGNYREIKDTRSLIDRLYAQIMGSLSNKASKELLDMLDKKLQENVKETEVIRKESEAAKKIAEQVAENLKNNTVDIIEGINPPTANLKDRKTLWQDISKGKPGILKLWKDGKWDPVVPDVESVKKETLEQVSKDIETTKSELNQKVQEAQKQATGQFNEVKESLQGVSRTISDVQNKQGEIDKKVTRFEQDSNGFKLSIESLTKKDTDISNKINTVEQTVEGTKKTISDVQQTATDLKKTTTEIKEQAGKISEKLTTVETKVNNDKAGGRNLLLDSNVKYEKTDYLINQYSLTENFSTGEEYTFVIKGSVLQGQKFGIWQNGGSNNVGYATSVYANGITYVTFKAVAATSGNERKLSLYNFPSNTTKAVVEWVALYKGNKPQDWTPAPENQVTNDEFTKRTTEIEKSVEGVKTTVSNVQNSQVGFEKRMSNVEQTASGLSTSVKQLTQTQTTQGKQITDANTKIEQQAQAIKAKVEIKQVEDYVGGFQIPELKNTVTKNAQDLMGEISKKVATQDYNKKTTELERLISVNAKGISLAAIKTEVYTKGQADGKYADKAYVEKQAGRIDVTEKAITSTVQKGTIISAINQTAEQIQIDVAKLKINADTIVQWLTAKGIDADVIKISGDKVTIDKNGITAKMADFFFEDERGQKFSVTPRKNLIPDHDFSHISFNTFNNYFLKIEYSPTWTIMSNPYIEKPVVNNYEPMVNPMRIDLSNWIRFTLFEGV
ncbi:TPA: phage tail protein, partial [Bacillus toyonensis]|nr:phage tail protein [Bacillus toyonensis]